MGVNGIPMRDLSRLFVYYNARLAYSGQTNDNGTYIRFAMESLTRQGVCDESRWPYDVSKVNTTPGWMPYRLAFMNKLTGYYRIMSSKSLIVSNIKKALDAKHPVVFGMSVHDEFVHEMSKTGWVSPEPRKAKKGNHAMLIVGYNDYNNTFIVRNSWFHTLKRRASAVDLILLEITYVNLVFGVGVNVSLQETFHKLARLI